MGPLPAFAGGLYAERLDPAPAVRFDSRMKRFCLLFLMLCSAAAWAGFGDFDFVAEGKLLDTDSHHQGDKKKTTTDWAYHVTLLNKSAKDYGPLKLEYIVFVKQVHAGSKGGGSHLVRTKGETKVEGAKSHAKFDFQTDTVMLTKTQLEPGWEYTNGARGRAADSLGGIWVRVMDGATQVGEFSSPPDLSLKEKWDAK